MLGETSKKGLRQKESTPILIIPVDDSRFQKQTVKCQYSYTTGKNNKSSQMEMQAYFPYNFYLSHVAILFWETESVSTEFIYGILSNMGCESVSILSSGNQMFTYNYQRLVEELNRLRIPIKVSVLILKGTVKHLYSDIVSENEAVEMVKDQLIKRGIDYYVVDRFMNEHDFLFLSSKRANRLSQNLAYIEQDFEEVRSSMKEGLFDILFNAYIQVRVEYQTVMGVIQSLKEMLNDLLADDLSSFIKYMPPNWENDYAKALESTEYFSEKRNSKIQRKLYVQMCNMLKEKLTKDIKEIIL